MKDVTIKLGLILLSGLLLTACGDNSSNTMNNAENTKVYSKAKDNAVNDVVGEFNGYRVEVYTNKTLEDNPSQSSKAIYGNINGKSTASLLSVNSDYEDGDVFVVKVFDEDKLVAQSEEAVLDGDFLEFNDVETGE